MSTSESDVDFTEEELKFLDASSDDTSDHEKSFDIENSPKKEPDLTLAETKSQNSYENADITQLIDIINESVDTLAEEETQNSTVDTLKNVFSELTKKIELNKVQEEEEENNSQNLDILTLKDEVSMLNEQNNLLQSKLNQQKLELESEIQQLREENTEYQCKISDLENSVKQQEKSLKQAQEQIDDANNDIKERDINISELQSKLDHKSEKIHSLKAANIEMESKINEEQIKSCEATIKCTSQQFDQQTVNEGSKLQQENKRLAAVVSELNKISESQAETIVNISTKNKDYQDVISRLKSQIHSMEREKEKMQKESEKKDEEIQEKEKIRDEMEVYVEELSKTRMKLEEANDVINPLKEAAKNAKLESIEEIPQFIHDSLNKKTNRSLVEENIKLRAIVESLVKIFNQNGESSGLNEMPLIQDEEIKIQLQKRISDMRKSSQEDVKINEAFNQMFGNENITEKAINELTEKDSIDAYASLLILAQINEEERNKNQDAIQKLSVIRNFVGKVDDQSVLDETCKFLNDLNEKFNDFIKRIKEVSNSFGKEKRVQTLEEYIDVSSTTLSALSSFVNTKVKFNGNISDIPKLIKEYLATMESQLREAQDNADSLLDECEQLTQEYKNTNALTQNTIDEKINDYKMKVSKLKMEVEKKDILLKSFEGRSELTVKEQEHLEDEIKKLQRTNEELSLLLNKSRKDLLRTREVMKTRMDQQQKILESSLQQEKENYEKEVQRLEKKKNEHIQHLEDLIKQKSKKLEHAKQQSKQAAELLQKSVTNQRITIQSIMKQNQELAEKLQNQKNEQIDEYQEKINELESKIQETNIAKYQLMLENEKIKNQANLENIEPFCQQIGDMLEDADRKKPESGWTAKDTLSEVSNVIEELKNSKLDTSVVPRIKSMTASINKWTEWASNLVEMTNQSIKPEEVDENTLRSIISDAVVINTKKAKAIETLQLLREQKKFYKNKLLNKENGEEDKNEQKETTARGVALAISFIEIVKKCANFKNAQSTLESVLN